MDQGISGVETSINGVVRGRQFPRVGGVGEQRLSRMIAAIIMHSASYTSEGKSENAITTASMGHGSTLAGSENTITAASLVHGSTLTFLGQGAIVLFIILVIMSVGVMGTLALVTLFKKKVAIEHPSSVLKDFSLRCRLRQCKLRGRGELSALVVCIRTPINGRVVTAPF
eukprot:931557-Amphidinium_carterae.1